MIYSKWLPDRGGYAYYETSDRHGLSDDLPTPRLRATSAIGVASTEIGRSLPMGAKAVGSGQLARGSVTPLDRSGLSGVLSAGATDALFLALLGAACAVAGAVIAQKVLRR